MNSHPQNGLGSPLPPEDPRRARMLLEHVQVRPAWEPWGCPFHLGNAVGLPTSWSTCRLPWTTEGSTSWVLMGISHTH